MRASEFITEAVRAWKRGKKGLSKLRFRCPAGPRKSRIVAKPADCYAAPNPEKIAALKLTRRRTSIRQARRAKRTKNVNPYSKLMQNLNKKIR